MKHSGLLYAALVFIGYINLHSYYSVFGVQVWPYLSIGELLLSFMPTLMPIAGYFLMLGLMGVLTVRLKPVVKTREDVTDVQLVWVRLRNPVEIIRFVLLLPALLSPLWIMDRTSYWMSGTVILLAAGLIVMGTCVHYSVYLFLFRRPEYSRVLIVAALIYGVFWLAAWHHVEGTNRLSGRSTIEATILTGDSSIVTTDEIVFIGQVSNAIFVYDVVDSTSLAIPRSEVRAFRSARERRVKHSLFP